MMGTTLIVPRIAGKKSVMVGGHRQTGVHSNDRKAGFLIKSKQWIREMSEGDRGGEGGMYKLEWILLSECIIEWY